MTKILLIILSLLLSCMMALLPLTKNLLVLNPSWCLLTLFFWTYSYPRLVNVGVAWCVGMVVDGLTGSLLGLHAISFVIVISLFDFFYRRFHMFHVLQQSLVIGALVVFHFLIIFFVNHLMINDITDWPVMLSAMTSVLCWPLYCLFGQKFHLIRG